MLGEIEEVNFSEDTLLVGGPDHKPGEKAILSITSDSEMVDKDNNPLSSNDLKSGMQVEVWAFELADVEPMEGTLELLKVKE